MLSLNCLTIVGFTAGMCCVVVSPSTRGCCKYQVSELILGCGSVIIMLFWQYWPQISSSLSGYFRIIPRFGAIPVNLCVFLVLLFAFRSLYSIPFV